MRCRNELLQLRQESDGFLGAVGGAVICRDLDIDRHDGTYSPQALILLGISGATGLSAVVIGNSKKLEKQTKLAELRQEEQKFQEQKANSLAAFPQVSKDRLAAIKSEIDKLSKQLEAANPEGFGETSVTTATARSFHRLQVVIWTMVLGAVFVQTVAQVMSMPEFPETLLTLLGISNATYLGFKIPEKS